MPAAVDRHVRHRLVPIHPEPVTGHPDLMDWLLPPGTFHVAGPVLCAPGEFGAMLGDGTITHAVVQPGGAQLLVRLRAGVSWRQAGAGVRTALHTALARRDEWVIGDEVPDRNEHPPQGPDRCETDELLREAVGAVLSGEFGEYLRSHGGSLELLDVTGGVVSVRFHGACHGCPAVSLTTQKRFERTLRGRCPMLVSVRRG